MTYKIRKSEWDVLFHQLVNSGKDKWDAGEIIKEKQKAFDKLYNKLKSQGKTEEDIELKFKEEFELMVQKLER